MTTPPTVEADLGWALGVVMRSYLLISGETLGDVPGGPRGYQVLTAAAKEPSSQLAIARQLNIDRTVMTYLLDDLEAAGLVERKPDPNDRRARRVVLTDLGGELVCTLEARLRKAENELLGPLDEEERGTLRHLLHRLATRDGENTANPCDVAEHMMAAERVRVSNPRGRPRA